MDLLKVENLTAGYGNKLIIRDINFELRKKELTGLLGLNGSGKTTLIKTIAGLIRPMAGKCLLDGKDIQLMGDKTRAQAISYMPQAYSIPYNTPVVDVVLMGVTPYLHLFETPSKNHERLAYEKLKLMGMEGFFDTNFNDLSEGQKQLIIIARNLMQNGRLMLFDEPDSALDFANKHMVLGKIKDIVKRNNRGGLVTLHDPNYALEYCDRIILLGNGSVNADFETRNMERDFLNRVFQPIYGDIDLVKHGGKFIIVRSDYEGRL